MKKFAFALAFSVAALAGPALADTMENAYGNTIVVTYANGAEARYYFNADGTMQVLTPSGDTVSGAYEIDGDQICFTPDGGERGCTAYVGGKNVGDSWTQTGTDGAEVGVRLEAGR